MDANDFKLKLVEEISNCDEILAGKHLEKEGSFYPIVHLGSNENTIDDFDALYEIISDPETMQHYPAPFDEERTRGWITWNLENYEKYGFGLWAVVLKGTGEFIGDCGISIQNIDGEMLPEIGYHIHKRYWRKGFGKEAARAARDWVFEHTDHPDPKNTISYAYAITREEWERIKLNEA